MPLEDYHVHTCAFGVQVYEQLIFEMEEYQVVEIKVLYVHNMVKK